MLWFSYIWYSKGEINLEVQKKTKIKVFFFLLFFKWNNIINTAVLLIS